MIGDDVGNLLALLGDGSFRDTLSVLQKVLSLSDNSKKEITLSEVEKITGAPKSEMVNNFAKGIVEGDLKLSLLQLDALRENGSDVKLFSELVLENIRKTLISSMMGVGDKVSPKKIAKILELLLVAHSRLGKSAIATLPLEMVVAECGE